MFILQEMHISDYDEVYGLWQGTPGVGLSSADTHGNIAAFLERNPGLSYVARAEGQVCGAVICGHDGRRGYLHHLVVHPAYRRQGIGQALVDECLRALRGLGIQRCHIFVYENNTLARAFWSRIEWFERPELVLMSRDI